MTAIEDYRKFVFPAKGIRERYRQVKGVLDGTEPKGFPPRRYDIEKRIDQPDGTHSWEKIASYGRNYPGVAPFGPFQQFVDGRWHDYALISTVYTRLEVMDLETGEIIAVEPVPVADKVMEQHTKGRIKEGDKMPGAGFCPMDFHVPDWWDEYDESFYGVEDEDPASMPGFSENYAKGLLEEFAFLSGQWGVYSGCVWGDDSSAKIRYVDLSRIREGIVATDDRFGYVELPRNLSLAAAVDVYPEGEQVRIAVPVTFRIETGKAIHKRYTVDPINWEDE